MGYVFSEILPWVFAALVVGFILGWVFWRLRWWLAGGRQSDEELHRTRSFAASQETRANDLSAKVDQQSAEVARLGGLVETLTTQRDAAVARADVPEVDVEGYEATLTELESANLKLETSAARCAEENEDLRRQIAALEGSLSAVTGSTPPEEAETPEPLLLAAPAEPATEDEPAIVVDLDEAAAVLGFKPRLDDLKAIEGIGPKIADLCVAIGISTWRQLADTDVSTLQRMLDEAGARFRMHDPSSWPRQAELLATGLWDEFQSLTDALRGGRNA
jgi:predicted flap endonuclease-1-like 5' DNA nuclease